TSSRSCLIIVPIRITLAGCSTKSVIDRSSVSSEAESCASAISRGSTPPITSMSSSLPLLNARHLLSRSRRRRGAAPFVDPGLTVVVDLRPPLGLVYRHSSVGHLEPPNPPG